MMAESADVTVKGFDNPVFEDDKHEGTARLNITQATNEELANQAVNGSKHDHEAVNLELVTMTPEKNGSNGNGANGGGIYQSYQQEPYGQYPGYSQGNHGASGLPVRNDNQADPKASHDNQQVSPGQKVKESDAKVKV